MSSNGGISSTRVSIPSSVRKTIQNIKEITNNHSEDDIYAMLKDCSMDPNETTQRLLHLDTFHVVKSKRDKRKEMETIRSGEALRWKSGHQGRGVRGARRNSSSQYNSADAEARRINFARKNEVEDYKDRDFRKTPLEKPVSIFMNGQVKLPNGSVDGPGAGYSKDTIVSGADSSFTITTSASAEHSPSALDPVLIPLRESRPPSAVGAIKQEVKIQQTPSEATTHAAASKMESSSNLDKSDESDQIGSEESLSMIEYEVTDTANMTHSVDLQEHLQAETHVDLNSASLVKPSALQGEEGALKPEKLKFSQRQHVIIPDHIKVPDAVKNMLNFGSIDACFVAKENDVKTESVENLHPSRKSAFDQATYKLSSGDNGTVTTASQTEHANHLENHPHLSDLPSPMDTKASSASLSKDEEPKADIFSAIGPPFRVIGTTPSYSFGFIPPMLANTLVQPEGFESQAHASSSLSGILPIVSTPSSTPPPIQSAAAGQSSIASLQMIHFFRQPFPPNFVPYSHYLFPFYVPPSMHQYYSHAGFPAPLPAGPVFLPPPSAATGMKTSPPHHKPGANIGNQVPSGIPSVYDPYSSPQVGYGPNLVATSGNVSTSEDLMPNGLKDNSIYPGQQSDTSAAWSSAAGRDTASFPLNSFLNLPLQGQHVIGPQSSHGAFAVYHNLPPMGTPAPGLPLLQPSQPTVGPMGAAALPPNAYQQPRPQPQSNWHS